MGASVASPRVRAHPQRDRRRLVDPASASDRSSEGALKPGDRVTVIAADDEYHGFAGTIADLTPEGKLVVDVEIPIKYRVVFDPTTSSSRSWPGGEL
jgi:transcription antitermination factor NusG